MDTIIPILESLLTRTEVVSAIVLFLLGLIGRANLERVPFFGVFIKILAALVDAINKQLEASKVASQVRTETAFAEKVQAAATVATVMVEGQEQLKTIGKVDGATAAATVTHALEDQFDLPEQIARSLTERAVRELHLP